MSILIFSFLLFSLCHAATFDIVNQCPYTIWPASIPSGGRELLPGQNWTIFVNPRMDDARIWARTGCTFNESGHGRCETGDCNGLLECQTYGSPPNTLAEFTLNGFNNLDFFDISLVDGFNVPMGFSPTAGCNHTIQCSTNVTGQWPDELKTARGCTMFKTDEYLEIFKSTNYSNYFKELFPTSLNNSSVSPPPSPPSNATFEIVDNFSLIYTPFGLQLCPVVVVGSSIVGKIGRSTLMLNSTEAVSALAQDASSICLATASARPETAMPLAMQKLWYTPQNLG